MPKRSKILSGTGALVALALPLVYVAYVGIPNSFATVYNSSSQGTASSTPEEKKTIEKPAFVVTHIAPPNIIKGIYMSQCVVGTPNFRKDLVQVADTTEINAIVIDIKDYSGKIGFTTDNPILKPSVSDKCGANDIEAFIGLLHDKGIYVIGRITVFQDPFMSALHPERAVQSRSTGKPWKDNKGLSFIDVGSREYWDYIVELSKESYKMGFDELNFDYIRYPSDGPMSDAKYMTQEGKSKPDMLKEFFVYLHQQLAPVGVKTSADLFGMTTTNTDDLNIGQVLENAFPYFDYIDPMVYPSHYPPNFNNWKNPNDHVYDLIHFVMSSAVTRAKAFDAKMASSSPDYKVNSVEKLRPWLQDFDYGGMYDVPEVKAQIAATNDVGLSSWLLWAPSNRYTLGALGK